MQTLSRLPRGKTGSHAASSAGQAFLRIMLQMSTEYADVI